MLKIVLFAYMINVRSTRKIENLCRNDIRFMYLSDEIRPSHMSICNFINKYLLENIEDIFTDITKYLVKKCDIDLNTVYIDGTKIEAFSNKYTWVWKNACITSRNRQFKKISEILNKINNDEILDPGLMFKIKETYTIEDIEEITSKLLKLSEKESLVFVYGKGKRKNKIQRYYDELKRILKLLKEYAVKIKKCGDRRNSYSKTDEDATFMRMKTDYMGNTSLLPAYNWQLVTSGEMILCALTSQEASDNKTFKPLMKKYKKMYGRYPLTPVGDAGYGTLENYIFCKENNMELFLKYQTWEKETHDKKFRDDIFRSVNFKRDEEGNIICPNNKKFIKIKNKYIKGNVDKRFTEVYQCEDCKGCPYRNKCCNGKNNRVININEELTMYHKEVRENLASERGIQLRINRSIQAEGTFGVIKQDYNFRRLTRVSLNKVNLEFYLIIIGFNLKKYHNLLHRENLIVN